MRYPRDFERIFTGHGFTMILKKQLYGAAWGNLDPKRPYDSWLRLFVRETISPKLARTAAGEFSALG